LQAINSKFVKSEKGQEAMKRRRSKRKRVTESETNVGDEAVAATFVQVGIKKAKKNGGKKNFRGQHRGGGTRKDGAAGKATIAAPTRRSARRGHIEGAGHEVVHDNPEHPNFDAKPIGRTGLRSSDRKL
jgi:hypothetical protein